MERTFDTEDASIGLENIGFHYNRRGSVVDLEIFISLRTLGEPKWHQIDTVRQKRRTSVDKFTKIEGQKNPTAPNYD